MADETIDAVKAMPNPRHSFPDNCDVHARADLFGMVPRETPNGEALFLRSLPREEAARAMGSRSRAKAVLNGDSVQAVVNAGKDPAYRLVRLGDAEAGRHALVENAQMREFRQPAETFGPYDPGAPRVQPDVSTPARAAAVKLEEQIRRASLETGFFIGPDGAVLLQRQGQPDRVAFAIDELRRMRGATFSHNHPGGMPFSVVDVISAAFARVHELRVVTPSARFLMTGLAGVWEGAVQPAYDAEWATALAFATDEARRDRLQVADIGRHARHLVWLRVSKRLGFAYRMELS